MNFNQSGRLFAFGCSSTNYMYPTWADIIGSTWDHYENWAQPSRGNEFIFNSIMECDARNKFTTEDTILIMWSGIIRLDYYNDSGWDTVHNKVSSPDANGHMPSIDGYELKSYAYMTAIHNLLTNRNIQFKMLSWIRYDTNNIGNVYSDVLNDFIYVDFALNVVEFKNPNYKRLVFERLYKRLSGIDWPTSNDLYNNKITNTSKVIKKEVKEFIKEFKTYSYSNTEFIQDNHPLPIEHLDLVQQHFPHLYIPDNTIQYVKDTEYKLLNGIVFDHANTPSHNPTRY